MEDPYDGDVMIVIVVVVVVGILCIQESIVKVFKLGRYDDGFILVGCILCGCGGGGGGVCVCGCVWVWCGCGGCWVAFVPSGVVTVAPAHALR